MNWPRSAKGIYRIYMQVDLPLRQIGGLNNARSCVSCGTCVEECPEEAISLDDEEIAVVNKEKCTECKTCVEACPSEAISME